MTIANYSTGVAAARSAGEISQMLVKAGARGIAQEYDQQGRMVGMTFVVERGSDRLSFALPVRADAVLDVLRRQRVEKRYLTREHAEKVAWRILRDWVRAQVAIIETEMVQLEQVMLPYMHTDTGATVFDRFQASRALPGGAGAAQ